MCKPSIEDMKQLARLNPISSLFSSWKIKPLLFSEHEKVGLSKFDNEIFNVTMMKCVMSKLQITIETEYSWLCLSEIHRAFTN